MAAIKRPAVFLAQFLRDVPPFNTLENICKWFADLGYAGVQIPGWDRRVIDIDQAATSNTYCDELKGKLAGFGLSITEVAAYLVDQVLAGRPLPLAGDGQVDFKRIFTLLTEASFDGWAVLEWECCVKSPEQGAREGAPFIRQHLIEFDHCRF